MKAPSPAESITEVTAMVHVCVVSGDVMFAESLVHAVADDDLQVDRATLDEALAQSGHRVDIAILDLSAGGTSDDIGDLRAHLRGHVIVLAPDARESSLIAPLAAGARGVVLRRSGPWVVASAVRAVRDGGLFIDPAVGTTLARLVALTARSNEGDLTRTELRVLQRFPRGLTNAEIAAEMEVSRNTIKTHVRHILSKLDCDDRVQAVQVARDRGLLL